MKKRLPQFLTIGEYNRILEHCFLCADTEAGLRNLIIVMLLGMLGLRTNAVIGLNIQDVNLPAGLLWIREKGGIARIVIMPKVMCRLIQHYLSDRNDHRGPLFLTGRSNTVQYAHLNPDHYAGYMRCHPFIKEADCFATEMYLAGVPIGAVQTMMGHSHKAETAIYVHVSDKL